jgi:uncharacterized damage-inducible protein DinB
MSKTGTSFLESAKRIFVQYQKLGNDAMRQLEDAQFHWKPEPESNSVYLIVKHMHGNMRSRWTDFLTSDGEKSWRNRDQEFEDDTLTAKEIIELYDAGWDVLHQTLNELTDAQMGEIVTIRGEAHSVLEAINRQIAHYSYHVGQIVFLAKACKSQQWNSLSIPKDKSQEFNKSLRHL